MATKKNKEKRKQEPYRKKGGCVKGFILMVLLLIMAYLGLHVYFIWQPAGGVSKLNQQVMDFAIAKHKVFPALKPFDLEKIDGRAEIIEETPVNDPKVRQRLETAILKRYPITFREDEINTWLSERLEIKQSDPLAEYVKAQHVWVNFEKDEIEFIIEREFFDKHTHVTSLFMQFEREKNGFSISRNASHVGQVKIPGGFARLIIPAFNKMAEELSEEIEIYKDSSGTTKLYDIKVEDSKITLDPRRPEERE